MLIYFQNNITNFKYGKGEEVITPAKVDSPSFNFQYKVAAKKYGAYNRKNPNGKNENYLKDTRVPPFGLKKLIQQAYGK